MEYADKQMNSILEQLDQVILFRDTLSVETDRGVALVCAAYLDEELRALLEKTFVNVPNTVGKLFEGTGPLATFSSRIDLTFAVGLLSGESHRALHLIRKVRNEFAHEHRQESFLDQDISARCQELIALNPFVDEKNPRKLYIRAVLVVLAQIHIKTHVTQHSDAPPHQPIDSMRDSFTKMRNTLDTLMSNLTEDQMSRLSIPGTNIAEKKRLVLETLARAGVSITENDLS